MNFRYAVNIEQYEARKTQGSAITEVVNAMNAANRRRRPQAEVALSADTIQSQE